MTPGIRIGRPADRPLGLGLTVVIAAGLAAGLAGFVASRRGNLAWDDASYLQQGLRLARLVEEGGIPALPELIRVGPKPPMLAAWIQAEALVVGRHHLIPVIVLAAVAPFALLMGGVATIAHRRFGSWAAPVSLLILAASPLTLSYGSKVMVETFMALWILLAYHGAARVLERPTRGRSLMLGVALGAAAMTKMTAVLLLPAPSLYFAAALARRDLPRAARVRVWFWILAPALAIAGPWYARNGGDAVRFSMRAAQHNLLAEGRTDSTPTGQRLIWLGEALAGWPVLAAFLAVAAIGLARRRRGGPADLPEGSGAFARITLLGLASGAVVLLVPPHFDPRFLMPAWPALVVCASGWIGTTLAEAPTGLRGLVLAALALGVASSGSQLLREPRTTTYWQAGALIDELVESRGVRNIGNIGDSPDWNVCKTGLINELRDSPSDCFVMHDLSRSSPEELTRRVQRFDALVVLDRGAFPPGFLAQAPGLNRAYDAIDSALPGDRFEPIEAPVALGLPPMTIYVARERGGPDAIASSSVRLR